jgi:hypothetical protein
MHTPEGWTHGFQRAVVGAGGEGKMRSDEVDLLSLSVKRLPLVAPLWAGAALLPFAMAVTLATAPPRGVAKQATKPAPAASAEPVRALA